MSDTWSDIQAVKSKQSSLREKLARRKKERQEVVDELIKQPAPATGGNVSVAAVVPSSGPVAASSAVAVDTVQASVPAEQPISVPVASVPQPEEKVKIAEPVKLNSLLLKLVERALVTQLTDITLQLPLEGRLLHVAVLKSLEKDESLIPYSVVEDLIQKFSAQDLICLKPQTSDTSREENVIESVDHAKLCAMWDIEITPGSAENNTAAPQLRKRKLEGEVPDVESDLLSPAAKILKKSESQPVFAIESLLNQQSAKERETKKISEEIQQILTKKTAKPGPGKNLLFNSFNPNYALERRTHSERLLAEKFKSQGGAQVREFCTFGTREDCNKSNVKAAACEKLHFLKIIRKHTDESLGDCSFLNTCFHMDTCKYVHYEIDYSNHPHLKNKPSVQTPNTHVAKTLVNHSATTLFPAQWVQCDLRLFDMSVLGKFSVIMADPPWDIHMELPYGTMSDDEMRRLNVPILQDDGFIFLWVTGRAMELGRECLTLWGYERVDEIIWVKTNQLQRIIRTGRTGHWLNHGKEHCLVGVKGNPKNINRGLDCDVVVAEVRATSHKPDEIYGIIERLSPGTRKIELFGRPHNIQPNWVTLGNQVDNVKLLDPEVVEAFLKVYPDGNCMKPAGPN